MTTKSQHTAAAALVAALFAAATYLYPQPLLVYLALAAAFTGVMNFLYALD